MHVSMPLTLLGSFPCQLVYFIEKNFVGDTFQTKPELPKITRCPAVQTEADDPQRHPFMAPPVNNPNHTKFAN